MTPARLERLAELHDRLPSAELVLHPPRCPRAVHRCRTARGRRRASRARSRSAQQRCAFRDRSAPRKGPGASDGQPGGYLVLRPRAARLLAYLSAKVYELSGEERPLSAHTGGIRRGGGVERSRRTIRVLRQMLACMHRLRVRHTQAVRVRSSGGSVPMDAGTSRDARADRVDARTVGHPRRRVSAGRCALSRAIPRRKRASRPVFPMSPSELR